MATFRSSAGPAGERTPLTRPHWPFAALTPHQLRQIAAQEAAMREQRLARWPA